ncbi:hypothetical protein ELI07_32760 (plasmid) [Rhizobium leguminosarum]|uniref:hypothetical protein n=1 Tax=Rhizobium leguminosarum TaxID=384 RepID=UPI0010305479|nr:hypothetical protein [Rhizobium leguminosarum]TAX01963.1 hypothetical protein ELI07_32760 [Rhizobium leguminosarum]TAZ03231.1 hypothetical protein ELH81_30915 [Rhizobium leguminosarum]
MSRYYQYRWRRSAQTDALVIFAPTKQFLYSQLVPLIDDDVKTDLWPEQLLVIVPQPSAEEYIEEIRTLLESRTLLRLKSAAVGVAILTYDETGSLNFSPGRVLQGKVRCTEDDMTACLQAGIANLVRTRQAVIRSSPGHHFVHPNKRHSEGFLRASNMLVQGNEIDFLSLAIMKHFKPGLKKVWIDSSSIASLIYAACLLRQTIDPNFNRPEVQSFSSYEGFDSLRKLGPADGCLIVISATATGRLREKILEEIRLPEERVITLFSASPASISSTTVFNVRPIAEEMGSPSMDVHDEADCPLCQNGSRPVELVGDQFLADSFKSIPYTLKQSDAPSNIDRITERFRSQSAFVLTSDANAHRLDVRLTGILKNRKKEIADLTARFVSISITHILPLKDGDSQTFAKVLANAIKAAAGKRPKVLKDPAELEALQEEVRGVLVAAACIGSGRQLQEVSLDLRMFGNKPRTFLIAVAKHSDGVDYKKLVSDLQHNNDHYKHTVEIVDKMELPYPNSYDAWLAERDLLMAMRDANKNGIRDFSAISAWIDSRLDRISGTIEGNDAFLTTTGGQPLQLRPTFAFWQKKYDPKAILQFDVFATIASVLEHARRTRGKDGVPPLARSAFFANILHWENFSRYNDGIIQASLLRAARPHELNYATESEHSKLVCKILSKLFDRAATQHGEGALEFALAVATNRLKLRQDEVETLLHSARTRPWDQRIVGMFEHAFGTTPVIDSSGDVPA